MKTPSLNDIRIRTELKPGDIGMVTFLHGKIYSHENQYSVNFEGYVAGGLHEFLQNYDPKNNRVWVCEYDSHVVGFLLLMNRGTSAQLRYFIFEPEVRGIGLGRKLMDDFMKTLAEFGYSHCYLLTTSELPAAAHLYTSYGFHVTEQHDTIEPFGKPVTEQRYDWHAK